MNIQIKAVEQYFAVECTVFMWYKVVLALRRLESSYSVTIYKSYWVADFCSFSATLGFIKPDNSFTVSPEKRPLFHTWFPLSIFH